MNGKEKNQEKGNFFAYQSKKKIKQKSYAYWYLFFLIKVYQNIENFYFKAIFLPASFPEICSVATNKGWRDRRYILPMDRSITDDRNALKMWKAKAKEAKFRNGGSVKCRIPVGRDVTETMKVF